MEAISNLVPSSDPASDLLKIAFCRALIERSNVSFAHQSMSLRKTPVRLRADAARKLVSKTWDEAVARIQAVRDVADRRFTVDAALRCTQPR